MVTEALVDKAMAWALRDTRPMRPWDVTAGFVLGSLVSVGMLLRVTATLQQLQPAPTLPIMPSFEAGAA